MGMQCQSGREVCCFEHSREGNYIMYVDRCITLTTDTHSHHFLVNNCTLIIKCVVLGVVELFAMHLLCTPSDSAYALINIYIP